MNLKDKLMEKLAQDTFEGGPSDVIAHWKKVQKKKLENYIKKKNISREDLTAKEIEKIINSGEGHTYYGIPSKKDK